MPYPKVTIVIRTHNCEKFVEQAVFSVITQDYPNLEVVVLDDASSDRTPEILEKLKKEYPQLILHRHFTKTKDSQIKRMHQELTKSDAKYLGWVDGDDVLLPGAISACVVKLKQEGRACGMVYTNYNLIDKDGRDHGLGLRCKIPFNYEQELLTFTVFHFRLFSREAWNKVSGYNQLLVAHEDWDLVLRVSEKFSIKRIPKSYYLYRRHEGSHIQKTQTDLQKIVQDSQIGKQVINDAIKRRKLQQKVELSLVPRYRLEKTENS